LPDLYATNKAKLVDIIYSITDISNPDKNLSEGEKTASTIFDNCILIRLPGLVVLLQKTTESKKTETGIKLGYPLGVMEHSPLFRYKSDIVVPEW
jgi:hypothetical protein